MTERILVFGMTENPGGVESFLYNYYTHINREEIQFDFLCNTLEKIAYEDDLLAMGARTFHIISRRDNRREFYKELDELFRQHSDEWSAVWVNVCSLANIDYLKAAKKYGIEKRIIHSHNSDNMDGMIRGMLHKHNKNRISHYATDYWACSEEAAEWFYNPEILPYSVQIPNAIDVTRMGFSSEKRNNIRQQLGLNEETYLIGNVGRLHFQKNQMFLLDVFHQYSLGNPDSRLVLVGKGEDESKLRNRTRELGIEDKVYFMGIQRNVDAWLSTFDLFLFPSVFEGLSVVALEAQANGLPVLASSDVIPENVRISENFVFYSLKHTPEEWAKMISLIRENCTRMNSQQIYNAFVEKGFEITAASRKLEGMLQS